MPEYHFVPELIETNTLPADRITASYERKSFNRARLFQSGEAAFILQDCLGSLILIDRARTGLNKLHIGELQIRNPHIERYDSKGKAGPRIDLNRIDIDYAQARLKELENWRREEYREQLREKYKLMGGYSVPHRLKQLNISPKGLEEKIEQMRNLVARLENQLGNTFISEQAKEIEFESRVFRDLADKGASGFSTFGMTKKERRKPKIIINPEIISKGNVIYDLIKKVFDFTENHENFDPQRAADYWKNVDSWGECRVGDYIFTRYEADFWHHLKRHFPNSPTVGSKFGMVGKVQGQEFFSTPRSVIDFAWKEVQKKGYNGEKTVIELDFDYPIGLEGVVALSDLPEGTEVKPEVRDGKNEVNIAYNVMKKPTNHLVISMGPLEKGGDGFLSIYPGKFCPELDEDKEFWDRHAFIG